MFSKICFLLFVSFSAFASYESAESTYSRGTISLSGYRRTIIEMVKGKYYFSVVPWMKDFLVKNSEPLDAEMERAFDELTRATGVRPFETLPENILRRSKSPNIKYILAKRLMKKGQYQEAMNELSHVDSDSAAVPFIVNMKAALYANMGNNQEAETQFKDCIRLSDRAAKDASSESEKNQMLTNRDTCIAGLARAQFAEKDHKKAELTYLDIQKNSFVWPEILFEEAWNSYYMGNYNRTLGKLISYKAPVFDFIFKPEVEVLKALTYMKMCLYDDAKKTVDDFYSSLLNPSRELRGFIMSRGKDYRYYYHLMADHEESKPSPLPLVDTILNSVHKDGAFKEMKTALTLAIVEHNELRKRPSSSFKANLTNNLKTVMDEYRLAIGAYIRASMVSKYAELYSAFQGMSYIKLEVLAQRKERLYQTDYNPSGKRGDVKYIDRNDKQYFWNFNGEFWADELGDYVFALRSEC